ncbi:MAG: PAS-domain containing protein [Caenispirillum bisanense]|nr:PAS-domain containing protein [Caenispirillum bisanense]MCA1974497.1 PAS-domain containing protein [Caenispirillum sp.]
MPVRDTVLAAGSAAPAVDVLAAINALRIGLAVFDADERLVWCNGQFRYTYLSFQAVDELVGLTLEEILRLELENGEIAGEQAAYHPEDWLAEMLAFHRRGAYEPLEQRLADGRWIQIKIRRTSDGGSVGHWADITDAKLVQLRLEDAVNNTADGFAFWDQTERLVMFNHRFADLMEGLDHQPAYGSSLRTVLEDLVHSGRLLLEETGAELVERWLKDRRQPVCERVLDYVHGRSYLIKERRTRDGGTVTVLTDITDLKEKERQLVFRGQTLEATISELEMVQATLEEQGAELAGTAERLAEMQAQSRAIIEAVPDLLLTVGADGSLREILSPDHEDLPFPADTPPGRKLGELLPDTTADQLLAGVRAAVVTGLPQRVQYASLDHDGQPQWFDARIAAKAFDEALVCVRNITEMRRIQDSLQQATAVAEKANADKTRFLAAASHDLRQPIQALNLFIHALSGMEHAPAVREIIGKIERSTAALGDLLNGLLNISKLEAGMVEPVVTSFPLGRLLDRLMLEYGPIAQEKDLTLRLARTSLVALSDQTLLERIIGNFLTNAIRYSVEGRVLLGVRRQGAIARIEVWDTGIGIDAGHIPLIFQEFHQVENAARNRREGLGLGLAIVDRLAQLLGHPITVRSVPGKGSCFAVAVPLDLSTPSAVVEDEDADLEDVDLQGVVILAIDDEPDILEGIEASLTQQGYRVITGCTVDEAVEAVRAAEVVPDVILSDYRLEEGMTGIEAIARVRACMGGPIPGILLTGDTAPEILRATQASGFPLLHKPLPVHDLKAAIIAALSGG